MSLILIDCVDLDIQPSTKHNTPNTSSSKRKRACGYTGGSREGLTPDPSTDGDKKSPWKHQEAEADDKEEDGEEHRGNSGKKSMPLPGFTKKRGPSAVACPQSYKTSMFAPDVNLSQPVPVETRDIEVDPNAIPIDDNFAAGGQHYTLYDLV